MPQTDRDRRQNARAARLAGWREAKINKGGWFDPGGEWHLDPPAYCTSIDLICRDLLPLLTDEQWCALSVELWKLFRASAPKGPSIISQYDRWLLTIDPAVLRDAVLRVLDSEGEGK